MYILYILILQNNKRISVSLLRKFSMFLSVFLYVVVVVRRLLRPHVEDYNTHQLIHHLSEEIKDMETYLMSAGLLPPEPAPPIQSSSPQTLPVPPLEPRRGHQTQEEDRKDAEQSKVQFFKISNMRYIALYLLSLYIQYCIYASIIEIVYMYT